MGPAASAIQAAIDGVNLLLAADGGSLTVVGQRGDTLVLRYQAGKSLDCPECVLTEDAVEALVRESLRVQAPFISQVQLIT